MFAGNVPSYRFSDRRGLQLEAEDLAGRGTEWFPEATGLPETITTHSLERMV